MKVPRTGIIIHIFALLHVITALICRSAGILDEIWLTMLTITMVVLIGIRMRAKVELLVACVIVTNLLGFILGTYGAKALMLVSGSELFIHSLSTFLTTEAIGWGICRQTAPDQAHQDHTQGACAVACPGNPPGSSVPHHHDPAVP